jgi:hypothetical protein
MTTDTLLSLALETIKDIVSEDGNEVMKMNIEVTEHLIRFICEQINYRILNIKIKQNC